ncbi:PilZ domain-containing protein [Myxococcota bacterium]|nr:PilZ domain-containing protein [Myxococcota bacterium]
MTLDASLEPFGRVLVALGKPEPRERIASALRRAGYRTETAPDGVRTLAALAAGPVLALVDLHLPQIDGFAVLGEMGRRREGAGPVVVPVSDRLADSRELRGLVRDLGGAPLLRLPATDVEVATLVRVMVGAPASQPGGGREAWRRSFPRMQHEVRIPARARSGDDEGEATLVSLGGDGGCLLLRSEPPPGSPIAARFPVPGAGTEVALTGRVEWSATRQRGTGPRVVTGFTATPAGPGADAYRQWRDALLRADPPADTAREAGPWAHDPEAARLDRLRVA